MAKSTTPKQDGSDVLELSTTQFDRPKFRLDGGDLYELRAREEMSVDSMKVQKALQARIASFQGKVRDGVETDESQFNDYVEAMVSFVELITVDVPRSVIEAMPAGMWRTLMEHYQSFGKAVDTAEAAATTS